jgi:quinol monooxygenase YgiN
MAIAIHHPHPDHLDDFVAHMHRVVDATSGAEGLLAFDCVRSEGTGALLGVSKWESREAFEAALPRIGANAHLRKDEWTVADDELMALTEV